MREQPPHSGITKKSIPNRLDALSNAIADLKLKKKRGGVMMSRVDMDALESDINEAFFLLNREAIQLCHHWVIKTTINIRSPQC